MNELATKFRDYDVGAVFLYTNEAHPGEHYPHHTSFSQKTEHAHAMRSVLGVTRPIYVDGLDGACHRAYGSMPNMTWVFNKACAPVYKSDWTDADSVANAIEYFLAVVERRRDGQRLAPFRVERLDYRTQDADGFFEGLERCGPKAVEEFRSAFPTWPASP